MTASFWNVPNLANWGTILGGIAVITGGATILYKVFISHLRRELKPVKQLERNGGESVADLVHEIRATQQHIHRQIDTMDRHVRETQRELHEHLGWHEAQ